MPSTQELLVARPNRDEYPPVFSAYIDLVGDGSGDVALASLLSAQIADTAALIERHSAKADHAYAPGKWTVKEVIGHLADGERVFSYRAMRFARADATDLPGFDENAFVANANFARRSLANVMTEFTAVRAATVALLDGLDAELLARRGRANGREVSVRALMYMCAGHELHHRRLFRERYGLA